MDTVTTEIKAVDTAAGIETPAGPTVVKKPVVFVTTTDLTRAAYYKGFHDAIKDVMAIAIVYAIVMYVIFRYVPE